MTMQCHVGGCLAERVALGRVQGGHLEAASHTGHGSLVRRRPLEVQVVEVEVRGDIEGVEDLQPPLVQVEVRAHERSLR